MKKVYSEEFQNEYYLEDLKNQNGIYEWDEYTVEKL